MTDLGKVRSPSRAMGPFSKLREDSTATCNGSKKDSNPSDHIQKVAVGRGILVRLYQVFAGSVRNDELRTFVDIFCDNIIETPTLPPNLNNGYFSNVDVLNCPMCFGILMEPVTLACGHSYCKKCLPKDSDGVGSCCKRCRSSFTKEDLSLESNVNILLADLIDKWWFRDVEAASLRSKGNELFASNENEKALRQYTLALDITPNDPLTLGNRSHVLLTLGRSEEALADIDAAVKNCPLWSKGYFRKCHVLVSLGRYEDAFLSLASCLCLTKIGKSPDDPTVLPVKVEMVKVLRKIFQQAAGNRRQSFDQLSPYSNIVLHSLQEGVDQFGKMNRPGRETEYISSQEEFVVSKCNGRDSRKLGCPYSKPTQYQQKKSKMNGGCLNDNHSCYDKNKTKIARLYDRSVLEINRIHSLIVDSRAKGSADTVRFNGISPPVDSSRVAASDVDCTLCYRLLHQPVTTSCGHTFCRVCLERSLDHSSACPLCKRSLEVYLASRRNAVTQFIEIAISKLLPMEHAERTQQHVEEIATISPLDSKNEISIFVCTNAFPTIQCPLFVFEPKYKLMIRRCVESGTKTFGMCMPVAGGGYADFGTLLEIRNVQYFADGRSIVDTIGRRRFRILSKSQKDGYNTARIEILRDRAVEEGKIQRLREIHDQLYEGGHEWINSISPSVQQRIHSHFGPMPTPENNWIDSTDGPAWTWWLLAILPLQSKSQLAILSYCGLHQRLESMLKVLIWARATQG